MYTNNALLIAANEQPVFLLPQMAARHGLITGATGTGKTVTVKVLAEAPTQECRYFFLISKEI